MVSFIRDLLTDIGTAWRLLTVLPLPLPEDKTRRAGYAAAYFPLVGLVLGVLLGAADWGVSQLFSSGVTAAIVLALWVGLTGMLHLDGFMDSCDGLLPPRDPARRLEIMRDSRVGAFGVVGVLLLLLLKYNGLLSLPDEARWPGLLAAPTLARAAMVWAMARYPLARSEGLGVFFSEGLGRVQVVVAVGTAVVVGVAGRGLAGLAIIAAAWLVTYLVAHFAMARLKGLSGDVYGAICEVVEVVVLLLMW